MSIPIKVSPRFREPKVFGNQFLLDREVALLPLELGRDESKESEDELEFGERLGMLGSGLSVDLDGSMTVGLSFNAIVVIEKVGSVTVPPIVTRLQFRKHVQ